MIVKEYPKRLCLEGDPKKGIADAHHAEEEARLRAQGYRQEYFAYPRSMYKDGNRELEERVVASSKEEASARKAGFRLLTE